MYQHVQRVQQLVASATGSQHANQLRIHAQKTAIDSDLY